MTWHNPAGAGIERRELLTIASQWISLSSPSALIRYDLPRKPGIGRAVADQVFADLPAGTPLQLAGDAGWLGGRDSNSELGLFLTW